MRRRDKNGERETGISGAPQNVQCWSPLSDTFSFVNVFKVKQLNIAAVCIVTVVHTHRTRAVTVRVNNHYKNINDGRQREAVIHVRTY